jgi:hypothetical protein
MAIYLLPLTLAFGVSQLLAGYVGIAEYLGPAWAIGLLAASLLFRFTLPITIGAFFGAMDVWGIHWSLAMLFAAPGLIFLAPTIIASILTAVRR